MEAEYTEEVCPLTAVYFSNVAEVLTALLSWFAFEVWSPLFDFILGANFNQFLQIVLCFFKSQFSVLFYVFLSFIAFVFSFLMLLFFFRSLSFPCPLSDCLKFLTKTNSIYIKKKIKKNIKGQHDTKCQDTKCPKDGLKMINEETKTQYCIMTVENQNEVGSYIPPYEALIKEAPNEEMAEKWRESKELHEKIGQKDKRFQGFAFNSVYMMKMECGHYEIFQHGIHSEQELIEWIHLMQEPKYYHKCTACICGGDY